MKSWKAHPQYIEFKLDIPSSLSSGLRRDLLQVQLNHVYAFVSKKNVVVLETNEISLVEQKKEYVLFYSEIDPQLRSNANLNSPTALIGKSAKAIKFAFFLQIIFNLATNGPMNILLTHMETFSLFMHQLLVRLPQDPGTNVIVQHLMKMVSFDPLEIDDFLDLFLGPVTPFS